MSAERGARPGGGKGEDRSQTAAVIVPHGGDVYSSLCWDDWSTTGRGDTSQIEVHLNQLDCVRGIVKRMYV
jgi:hypothetical protein